MGNVVSCRMVSKTYHRGAAEVSVLTDINLDIASDSSVAIIARIKEWGDTRRPQIVPQSLLAKAIGYTHNQWATLIVFLQRGYVALDNNRAENAIRPLSSAARPGSLATASQAHRPAPISTPLLRPPRPTE